MSEILKIRLAARCAAAGRPENEDNFQVAENLSISNVGFDTDKIFPLGSKGTLLLVCDGMGGMNAGEVASAIGVETIKGLFAPQLLTADVIANDESICNYMKRAIVKADSRIKEEAQKDNAKQGMGSTAVMAWLLGQKVYVAWCGDSRCYRYNPATGLEILSHDHSYVQDLVDTGQLSPELAFDHPNKNIITRSLGDPRGAARPDVKVYDLHIGDVILLCSDGLNDSLRDSQIEQAISRSLTSMANCLATLWSDSNMAGWHDNVTIVLAQVVDESTLAPKTQPAAPTQPAQPAQPAQPQATSGKTAKDADKKKSPKRKWKIIIPIATVLILITCGILWVINKPSNEEKGQEQYKVLYTKLQQQSFENCDYENFEKTVETTISDYKTWDSIGRANKIDDHNIKAKPLAEYIIEKIENQCSKYSGDSASDAQKQCARKVKDIKENFKNSIQ